MSEQAEKRVEDVLSTLPPYYEWGTDIYKYIRECAELLQVAPGTLNLAIGFVSEKTLSDPANLTRSLLLILEYLRTEDEHKDERK